METENIRISPSKILLALSFSFLFGVFTASYHFSYLSAIAAIAILCVFLCMPKNYAVLALVPFLILFFFFGVFRLEQNKTVIPAQAGIQSLLALKNKSNTLIARFIPPPEASLLQGILLGERSGIPKNITSNFNAAGITHIIAISGFNISILATYVFVLLNALHIGRKRAFWFFLAIIALFVLLVGASSSVVRAGIMAGIAGLAKYVGRINKSLNALVVTAALMVAQNPKILASDRGFQLSFLAMAGLLFLAPVFEHMLKRFMPPLWGVRSILSTTAAAIVCTGPLIAYDFNRISLIAPFSNILILPVLPLVMLFGFFTIAGGAVLSYLGQILGWISWLLLAYIVKLSALFASLPFASLENVHLPVFAVLGFYIVLFAVTWRLHARQMYDS
jgi:competence protein ComEC